MRQTRLSVRSEGLLFLPFAAHARHRPLSQCPIFTFLSSFFTSSYAVGYSQSNAEVGSWIPSVGQFDKCGTGVVTLKDLMVTGEDCGANVIQFLRSNGATRKHTFSAAEKSILDITDDQWDMMFIYVSQAECDDWDDGTTPGWYFLRDEVMLLNVSEDGLEGENLDCSFGKGFLFQSGKAECQLQSAGEVAAGNTAVSTDIGSWAVIGNASPVDRDLGYFTVTGEDCGANVIQFLRSNGATRKWTFTDDEKTTLDITDDQWDMMFIYVSQAECDEWDDGTTPGWYFLRDEVMLLNMNEKITVKAGEGFLFQSGKTGVDIVLPGAIGAEDDE